VLADGVAPMSSSAGMSMLPWWPRDFLAATRGWPLIARGAYRELLDAQWDLGALPEPERELCALIIATRSEWRVIWSFIGEKFPISEDGLRRNLRLEKHRSRALSIQESHQLGAAVTNAQRRAQRDAQRALSESPSVSPPSPSPSPSKIKSKSKKPTAAAPPFDEPWFEDFKAAYPKRAGDEGWPKALRAAQTRIRQGHRPEEFIEGAKRYAAFVRATQSEGTLYVKQAATFLGPDKHFLASWPLPATKADNRLAGNLAAADEFMRRTQGQS
jgi:uncharacterized protein YdaU (DUF1376 family)